MKILDRLPIQDRPTSLRFGGKYTTVRRDQVAVWMSVHAARTLEPETTIPKFPALLDTGNNFGFSIQERQLREWAGIDPRLLAILGDAEINSQVVNRREATVWLYPNIPGRQDVARGQPPLRLRMDKGIAIYAQEAVPTAPRLPLLGLPALLDNDLDRWLDPERRCITVQSRTWRRRLIRLLCRL